MKTAKDPGKLMRCVLTISPQAGAYRMDQSVYNVDNSMTHIVNSRKEELSFFT